MSHDLSLALFFDMSSLDSKGKQCNGPYCLPVNLSRWQMIAQVQWCNHESHLTDPFTTTKRRSQFQPMTITPQSPQSQGTQPHQNTATTTCQKHKQRALHSEWIVGPCTTHPRQRTKSSPAPTWLLSIQVIKQMCPLHQQMDLTKSYISKLDWVCFPLPKNQWF